MTFDLDLWPTDLNINRGHLLIKDYLPTKFEASWAKHSWVISCTRLKDTDIQTDRHVQSNTPLLFQRGINIRKSIQWWCVNPGSDSQEISLIWTKSAGTDFLFWTDGRFSNLENTLIQKYRPGTNVSRLTNHHCISQNIAIQWKNIAIYRNTFFLYRDTPTL